MAEKPESTDGAPEGLVGCQAKCLATKRKSPPASTPQGRLSTLAIVSNVFRKARCLATANKLQRRATSNSGTHSCTEPRAIIKEFLRSGLVNRPLPSAKFAAMESAARCS